MNLRKKVARAIAVCEHGVEPEEITPLKWALADAAITVIIKECAKALEDDATKCDCAAFSASECNCGSWEDWKRITSVRAAEIIMALAENAK